jgi:tRNA(fMet)-specific endonuclease VapC
MTRRAILDSNAVSDYIMHRNGVFERAVLERSKGRKLGTCFPVVGELYAGIEMSQTKEKNRPLCERGLRTLVIWPYDLPAARQFGLLRAELKRIGRPMQQVDLQLAAIALALGDCSVVSSDSDLLAVPGLQVENWAKASANT